MSNIEWTEKTWNPIKGCMKVSDGCKNCYAIGMAHRLKHMGNPQYQDVVKKSGGKVNWTGEISLDYDALEIPLKNKKPTTYFVNSMSDLFYDKVPIDFIDKVYNVMQEADWHTYQILTKRPQAMADYLRFRMNGVRPRPYHIWHGVSVEGKDTLDRIDIVRDSKTYIAFVSFEPLIDSVSGVDLSRINWAIVGGESGKNARPMNPQWVQEIHDACQASGTDFFFKQWGTYGSDGVKRSKKANGREWRGKEWNNMPPARLEK